MIYLFIAPCVKFLAGFFMTGTTKRVLTLSYTILIVFLISLAIQLSLFR